MPFTPYHFGPGLLCKSIAPQWFSMAAFATVQVVIDVETLYHILNGDNVLHQELHTFVGATTAGLVTAGLILATLGVSRRVELGSRLLEWTARIGLGGEIRPAAVLVGGIVGGVTHPLFDGLMHRDIRPFRPFSDFNPLLGLVDVGLLHFGCLAAGALGVAILVGRLALARARREPLPPADEA